MKIVVKSLKGGSSVVEVTESTTILEIKRLVEIELNIPIAQQALILTGKPLQDDKPVSFYPKITEGTKLFVVMRKPESLPIALTKYLRAFYNEEQSKLIVDEFMRNFQTKVDSLSLDDLERIAKSDIGD